MPVITSPSFGSIDSVNLPDAPVVVQSSGLPSVEPHRSLGVVADTSHTRLFQTAQYFALGGLPPRADAAAAAVTFTGLSPEVARLQPIAIPLNVHHDQKVLFGRVRAPLSVVSPVPSVSTIRRVVPSVSKTPTSPLSVVK